MKFSTEEQEAIWNLVACSLHLGNLTFDESSLSDCNSNDEYLKFNNIFIKLFLAVTKTRSLSNVYLIYSS